MVDEGTGVEASPCVEYFDYYYDYLDHVQIHKPVFHFVNYDYNVEGIETIIIEKDTIIGMDTIMIPDTIFVPFSIPALQFTCIDDPDDPQYNSDNNAFKIAKDLIYWANNASSNVETSMPGGAVLPGNDLKVRYTDVDDCNDIVIIENGGNVQNIQGKLNIHIINTSNTSFGTMGSMGAIQMRLKNIGNKIIHPNRSFDEWIYGPLMNHEIGHDFGLCHAQHDGNLCEDIPNNQVCASGETDPACGQVSISCDSRNKNNIMISGAAKQRGFTPCQFTEAFPGMVDESAWRTTYLNECLDIVIDQPQETTHIECELFICSKLIVKTGSELVLRGRLIMDRDAEIQVERGARFVMENGNIVGGEFTPGYWKGIRLSDGYTDQVDINTSIVDYPALAPSSFVAIGGVNINYIQDAEIAIASRISPLGTLGGKTSLIHLDGFWIRDNEVGLSINNFLNDKSVNASFRNTWFSNNTKDDLIIIAGKDIDIRESFFFMNSLNGITLIDTELSGFNDCVIQNREIGMDIKTTYPFHPGFELGDESGISNRFSNNNTAIQIGGGIGVGNTRDMEIFRGIFQGGNVGIQVLGASGYEIYGSTFPSVKYGILSAFSGIAENTIHCNDFADARDGWGIATIGNNRNLTMHSNEFDMADNASIAIWRLNGDIFQVQSAQFDATNSNTEDNPPAGNQFLDVSFDLTLFPAGNTVDYLVPQPGEGAQYYPETEGDYNTILSTALIADCPEDNNFPGGPGGLIPDNFVPNDSTDNWQDPIGDPMTLDEYLAYLINLGIGGGGDDADGHTRSEIARVRFALYLWVVYMLAHPDDFDLTEIEDFADDDYQRLLVGYYIHTQDPYNADRILAGLSRANEANTDFATIQEINLKRLFPAYYNPDASYIPTSTELQNIRGIAEEYSENTGYASALYYLYTNEKVYPDFAFVNSQPRSGSASEEDAIWVDIFPNPTTGSLELNSNGSIYEYSLYDSYGRLEHSDLLKGTKNHIFDISNLSVGLYFLKVKCGSKIITKKVVKI